MRYRSEVLASGYKGDTVFISLVWGILNPFCTLPYP